jgi:hypothetical protein
LSVYPCKSLASWIVIIILLFGVTLKKHADCAHITIVVIYNKITHDHSIRGNSLKTAPSFCVCVWILSIAHWTACRTKKLRYIVFTLLYMRIQPQHSPSASHFVWAGWPRAYKVETLKYDIICLYLEVVTFTKYGRISFRHVSSACTHSW